jgi:hypothetical protein
MREERYRHKAKAEAAERGRSAKGRLGDARGYRDVLGA